MKSTFSVGKAVALWLVVWVSGILATLALFMSTIGYPVLAQAVVPPKVTAPRSDTLPASKRGLLQCQRLLQRLQLGEVAYQGYRDVGKHHLYLLVLHAPQSDLAVLCDADSGRVVTSTDLWSGTATMLPQAEAVVPPAAAAQSTGAGKP